MKMTHLSSLHLLKNLNILALSPWWLRWYRICLQFRKPGFDPWIGKITLEKGMATHTVFFPGEFHGQGSLAGYSLGFAKNQTQLTNTVRVL